MPIFTYTASTKEGKIEKGEVEFSSRDNVFDSLRRQNLLVISVKEKPAKKAGFSGFRFFKRISLSELVLLTRNLSSMIEAGVALPNAIDVLFQDARNTTLKEVLFETKQNLEKGLPLSHTFALYPKFFSKVFLGFVKSGEASGSLSRSFSYLSLQLKKEQAIASRIKGALTYPVILLVASLAVIIGIFSFILPRLTDVFLEMDVEFPWTTRVLLGIGKFFKSPFNVIMVIFALGALIAFFVYTKVGKGILRSVICIVPQVRNLLKKIEIARFVRSLGWLIKSGVPILGALDITSDAIEGKAYKEAILDIKKQAKRGVALSNSLESKPELFPHLVSAMVRVGERTGKQEETLLEVARFYEKETAVALKNVVTLIQPVFLLLMGLLIGAIAFSIIVPIYQMISGVG